ncbi:MAG: bifunctional hydroxymethylpyrimidine kinase/phosphomethylpyrimidine kinase [Burkholderiaceae bacterium]|nr:bifunctional hydroxymethylpyrimidine kinase/phosphomethylpyrimidine kinase [Burkholderiaceae bacterium]
MAFTPKKVLSIAGSDSGGGAGIQADLKTISALGCYGLTAITALTAQNTQGVRAIHAPDPAFLGAQLDAVFEDIGADAVKIGMLHSPEIVAVVADALKTYRPGFVVLDPVMVATSGDKLITPQTQEEIVRLLFPLATLVTPNLDELSWLIGQTVARWEQFESAAVQLYEMGARNVLVKGGHMKSPNLMDMLVEFTPSTLKEAVIARSPKDDVAIHRSITEIVKPRIDTNNLHGTGCTLSSAIACYLALGYPLKAAVKGAQDYVYQAISHSVAMRVGHGHGPVNHGFDPQPMHLTPKVSGTVSDTVPDTSTD